MNKTTFYKYRIYSVDELILLGKAHLLSEAIFLKTHSLSKDMQSLEERVVCILALQRQRIPDTDIASYLHLSLTEFELLTGQLKRDIIRAKEEGNCNLPLPYPLIVALADHYSLSLFSLPIPAQMIKNSNEKMKKSERTLRAIKSVINERKTILEIAKEIKRSPSSVRNTVEHNNLCSLKDIQTPPIKIYLETIRRLYPKKYSSLLELAQQGKSLGEIKDQNGITRERVSQMIEEMGIYYLWRIKRTEIDYQKYHEKKMGVQMRQQFFSQIVACLYQKMNALSEEDWPVRKTAEYILQRKRTTKRATPRKKLLRLFTEYRNAEIREENLSFSELAKRSKIYSACQVGKIFKGVNIPPLNKTRESHPITMVERKRFQDSGDIGMSDNDIVYFSGYRYSTVARCRARNHAAFIIEHSAREHGATCRLASQTYELADKGSTEKEIADKLKIEQKAARYFLTNKEKIEKEIIRAINLFHPDEDIKKPYS